MHQNHHHLKKHVKHHKHAHERTVSVGRGGLYVPGQNWWGPMFCGVGLCSGVNGDHDHDTDGDRDDTVGVGGEGGESATAGIGAPGGAGSTAAGM